MDNLENPSWIAFSDDRLVAKGAPPAVAAAAKTFADSQPAARLLVLDAETSRPVEIDLSGSLESVLARLTAVPAPDADSDTPDPVPPGGSPGRKPGRPRLGVVAREVTLLPRHWEWLSAQPGGASVALRKLVEQARRTGKDADRARRAQESAYRFMTALAGDLPGYEEAIRALFAADTVRLRETVGAWPRDIREHTLSLAELAAATSRTGNRLSH